LAGRGMRQAQSLLQLPTGWPNERHAAHGVTAVRLRCCLTCKISCIHEGLAPQHSGIPASQPACSLPVMLC
jgi:hypothetical protein